MISRRLIKLQSLLAREGVRSLYTSRLDSGNSIINHPRSINSKITFSGHGNVLYCESTDTVLENSILDFRGSNSIIYLSRSSHRYKLKATVYNDSSIFIGRDNYFNGSLAVIASEQKNVVIGNDGLFSFGCWIRTADPHLVYDSKTKKRLNYSKSVLVGDHVWLGQNVAVLKGSMVGSGSIVGASSVVAGKSLASNASYGGVPAKLIRKNIFFKSDSVHKYTKQQTLDSGCSESRDWVYEHIPDHSISMDTLDKELSHESSTDHRIEYIKSELSGRKAKNRFFIGD